jgi:hypothetical protein
MATNDYYIWDINLCAISDGMSNDIKGGMVGPLFKSVNATGLPICDTGEGRGGNALVCRHKHKGHVIQDRQEQHRRD